MTVKPLETRTAFVTGPVQGIGLAVANPDQTKAAIAQVRAAGAPDVIFLDHDLSDTKALRNWREVDVLVNTAGVQKTTSLADATGEIRDAIMAVNLTAPFHVMRQLMSDMATRGFGQVINVASVHGLVASPNKTPYVASKFGLVGLSRMAAIEYAEAGSKTSGGVTVNCICPGWTETAITQPQVKARAAQFSGDRDLAIADPLAEKQPSKRTSDPSTIGELCLRLCNRVAHNITGTSISIDGGWATQ